MPDLTPLATMRSGAVPRFPVSLPYRLALAWCGFLALMLVIYGLGLDFTLADVLYRWQGGEWALQDHVLLQDWLHQGGRTLSQWMGAGVIVALLASLLPTPLRRWRRALLFLFLAVATSTLSISILKQLVSMECPWDLARYGGDWPFVGLLAWRPSGMPDTACFPAGHASAGYAWLALYFFLAATWPRWRWLGLATGLGLGLAFGIAQQLRGAHFLSHDLWTLMLCWTISTLLASWLLPAWHLPQRRLTLPPNTDETSPDA
ncbi:phosphatase PAP2 family protein [Halomonas sp. 25-S5]|uniref:phosphatase PAP2 family protein n=1 Tax=Halomonas sp. 25-S5 TaxID=2994065 RepID=UPI0024685BA9|nr:phosphatase PAP2 family protein [Halomonas sp. 25-S5]